MFVKGVGIIAIREYVRLTHVDRYPEWLDSLSKDSREIFANDILYSNMYPYRFAILEPTEKACKLFFNGDPAGALEMGRFAAEFALKGVLKIFIRVATPQFVMTRVSAIFSSYFSEGRMIVASKQPDGCVIQMLDFPQPHILQDLRIQGWIERGLDFCGCRDVVVKMSQSMGRGDALTEYISSWA
jgi:hypothetical protein